MAVLKSRSAVSADAPTRPLQERWSQVGGLRVFSRVSEAAVGTGAPPIVCVHGFANSGRYMVPLASLLAAHYPTYVPDLPGYGRSERPRHPLSIPELAEALAGYLDAVGVPRAVILGNSLGCLVAAELALRDPDRTESVVLVSPADGKQNQPLLRGALRLARDSLREPVSLLPIVAADYLRFGPLNAIRVFHGMSHYPTMERLAAIPVPALVIVGTRDPLVSTALTSAIVDSPTAMEHLYHFAAAHAINYSHPRALARLVRAYLQGHPPRELVEDGKVVAWRAEGGGCGGE